MKINWLTFLNKTRLRDGAVFLAIALLVTLLLQLTVYSFTPFDFEKVVVSILVIGQFYLAAFLALPVRHKAVRRVLYLLLFALDYLVFRELLLAFSPRSVERVFDFELIVGVVFLLSVFSRSVRMYFHLREQLVLLNYWTQRKILFKDPEEIVLNMGHEGELKIHPNELVYIRTRAAGDHTKVFGVKYRQPRGVNAKLTEHATTTYRNFDQVLGLLRPYPQFKKVHSGAIINTAYPFKTRDGILNIEGRRFKVTGNLT